MGTCSQLASPLAEPRSVNVELRFRGGHNYGRAEGTRFAANLSPPCCPFGTYVPGVCLGFKLSMRMCVCVCVFVCQGDGSTERGGQVLSGMLSPTVYISLLCSRLKRRG